MNANSLLRPPVRASRSDPLASGNHFSRTPASSAVRPGQVSGSLTRCSRCCSVHCSKNGSRSSKQRWPR
jgi:hypothetical protein